MPNMNLQGGPPTQGTHKLLTPKKRNSENRKQFHTPNTRECEHLSIMDHNLRNKQESTGTMKGSLCMDPTSMYNRSLKPAIEPHTFAASLLTTEIDNQNTFFHLENAHHMLKLVSSFSQILLGLKPVLKLMKLLNILQG